MTGSIIIFMLLITLFLLWHELGHIFAAKIIRLTVSRFGLKFIPVPHFYVIVDASRSRGEEIIFYLSGLFMTLVIFSGLYATRLLAYNVVYYAIAFQFVLDTNPFFSDFTLALKAYKFSIAWYVHFILWGVLIGVLFSRSPGFLTLFSN